MLIILIAFPLFIMIFMVVNKADLGRPSYKRKWETLYQGIDMQQLSSLMYYPIFCVRRFQLVLINLVLSPGFPLTNFEQHQYLAKDFAFIILQTAYFMYIVHAQPHSDGIFNTLELWNEGMIVLMCYIMLVYTGIGSKDPSYDILSEKAPQYLALLVTALIVLPNFGVLIRMTIKKAIHRRVLKRRQKVLEVTELLRRRNKKF